MVLGDLVKSSELAQECICSEKELTQTRGHLFPDSVNLGRKGDHVNELPRGEQGQDHQM